MEVTSGAFMRTMKCTLDRTKRTRVMTWNRVFDLTLLKNNLFAYFEVSPVLLLFFVCFCLTCVGRQRQRQNIHPGEWRWLGWRPSGPLLYQFIWNIEDITVIFTVSIILTITPRLNGHCKSPICFFPYYLNKDEKTVLFSLMTCFSFSTRKVVVFLHLEENLALLRLPVLFPT